MVKCKLLGIHGKKRAGKDTVALYLTENYGAYRYAFADPLKEGCAAMFGVPLECFTDDTLKETQDPFWGVSYRWMAQIVGTEAMRQNVRDDFWVKRARKEWKLFKKLKNEASALEPVSKPMETVMVVPDVRFENEVNWVESEGGCILHIEGKYAVQGDGHASEAGVEVRPSHRVIDNSGTFEELYQQVRWMMEDLEYL